jgi:hypothetical protein
MRGKSPRHDGHALPCAEYEHAHLRFSPPRGHGAWFWKKVVPLLQERGHIVFAPTLTGLGERSHLARADIGLDVHITDVVNVLKYEDLRDVILVGHSASGA